jgi:hypothetical protein
MGIAKLAGRSHRNRAIDDWNAGGRAIRRSCLLSWSINLSPDPEVNLLVLPLNPFAVPCAWSL